GAVGRSGGTPGPAGRRERVVGLGTQGPLLARRSPGKGGGDRRDGNVPGMREEIVMKRESRFACVMSVLIMVAVVGIAAPSRAADKPNILFIMGDDIGWMQVGAYHRGIGLGETPNIDRLANEGGLFTTNYPMQSCTSGRSVFFTGMYPLRRGMIPPQLPGSPSYLRPGTPAIAKFLLDQGYNTGEFGKNHLGDHTAALPTAHGFQ